MEKKLGELRVTFGKSINRIEKYIKLQKIKKKMSRKKLSVVCLKW